MTQFLLKRAPFNDRTPVSINPAPPESDQSSLQERALSWWKARSLRSKATALAIAIGIIPVTIVGGVAYSLASYSLTRQIVAEHESRTLDLRQSVSTFTNQLVDDAETVAKSALLKDPKLRAAATKEQKIWLLNSFIDTREGIYDSIAVFDPQGNLLFQSKSPHPFDPSKNYSDREYFQRAIATGAPAVNNPDIVQSSGDNSLEVAAPVVEAGTNKILAVVRLRMPTEHLTKMFERVHSQGWEYKLIGSDGQTFAADEKESAGQPAGFDFDQLPQLRAQILANLPSEDKAPILTKLMSDRDDRERVLVSFTPIEGIEGVLDPGWGLAISRPTAEAFAPLSQLSWTLSLGVGAATLLVGAIAAGLANRATRPILAAAGAVEKIGRGELNTRLEVGGQDELATLEANINAMAGQLGVLVQEREEEARRSWLLKDITLKLAREIDSKAIFTLAVEESRQAFLVERAIVYRFEDDWQGAIAAESFTPGCASTAQSDLYFVRQYVERYRHGWVQAIPNIYQSDLNESCLKQLGACSVKAMLVAPILMGDKLLGLLIAQQCDRPRNWEAVEIDLFSQIATQVGLACDRAQLLEQQKAAKEELQRRALELLMEVDPIAKGDLTIRASVTDDEVGTIADSYNATVESLRKIVTQVQTASQQVTKTTSQHESSAQSLSEKALQHSETIAIALGQIQTTIASIRAVAAKAEQAEVAVQKAARTVETGDAAMNRTVAGIVGIRETVAQTAKKVKRLGESSQEISQVVNLISSFAAQTNLLALNASIEAARAGEEGRGFAIVAEEVRSLAQQSAGATAEIEKLVAKIQLGTSEVVAAMETGTEQVVAGTKLVDDTRSSLNQIAAASSQISQLVQEIALAAAEQSQESEAVTQTMKGAATISQETSVDAIQVSSSIKKLLAVAQDLQTGVRQFKVE